MEWYQGVRRTLRTRTGRPLDATTAARLEPRVELAGETLVPLPEGALFWPDGSTVFIADPHFGKTASFRAAGLPLPGGTTGSNLGRIERLLARTGAERLVVLGDLFHASAGRRGRTLARIVEWRKTCPDLDVVLVRGNHDRSAGDPPEELGVRVVSEPYDLAPFVLRHHPEPETEGYVLAGHIHPAVRLRGRGRQRTRLPCFWFGERVGVLPAFGAFTGAAVVEPAPGDRIYVIADGEVVPM